MENYDWKIFFIECCSILGKGDALAINSSSWCSWTTYRRLNEDAGYWTGGIPELADISDVGISDGSVWGQAFLYSDLAHVVIPRYFYWEKIAQGGFENGTREQSIDLLADNLRSKGINHNLTNLVLEVKCY